MPATSARPKRAPTPAKATPHVAVIPSTPRSRRSIPEDGTRRPGRGVQRAPRAAETVTNRLPPSPMLLRPSSLPLPFPYPPRAAGVPDPAAAEARFRLLSAALPVGVFQADARGRVTYANPRLAQVLALPAGAIVGR